jgi:hypothetical protein
MDRVRAGIAEQFDEEMGLRLTRRAHNYIRMRCASAGRELPADLNEMSEDFAYKAVRDVLAGDRKWDPDLKPNLLGYLMDVVESNIDHWLASPRSGTVRADELPEPAESPAFSEFMLDLRRSLADEPELWSIVALMSEGVVKPSDIAGCLGVETKEVHNRTRRLERRVRTLQAEHARGEQGL